MLDVSLIAEPTVAQWIKSLGYLGIFAIVFAETAFFFCFFLPGDSLLFTAGMLASNHILKLSFIIPLIIIAAFSGYIVGYYIGLYSGHRLAKRPDTWYYKKVYAQNAHNFMEKYGKLALLLGRMIAVVRTFIPLVAGMAEMNIVTYNLFNFIGAVLWGCSIPVLGYYLGRSIPDVSSYFTWVIAGIVIVSVLPALIEWVRKRY